MKLTALPDKTAIVRDSLVRRQSNERLVTLIDDHVPIESRISTERERKKTPLHLCCDLCDAGQPPIVWHNRPHIHPRLASLCGQQHHTTPSYARSS